MASEPFKLNVWSLHPKHIRIVKAEKTLHGTAHADGIKFCKPFASSNSLGFWVFPAIDFDLMWKSDGAFEYRSAETYHPTDYDLVKSLIRDSDQVDLDKFATPQDGRTKFSFGSVEPGVCQMWTGVILETPPGWCLQIQSPINFPHRGYRVMSGVLETDWMQYDIWINLVIEAKDTWITFRRDEFPPIAQLVPIRREVVEGDWSIGSDEMVNRDSKEANRVFEFWLQYNKRKYGSGGKQMLSPTLSKDATTYYKVRAETMGKGKAGMEPLSEAIQPKEIARTETKIPPTFIPVKCPFANL